MSIPNFKAVNSNEMTFREIFSMYDSQFTTLRNFLLKLGDKFIIESFSDNIGTLITLSHSYAVGEHQLLVFLNGAPQWVDTDYTETSTNSITFINALESTDEVRVIILQSVLLYGNLGSYINTLEDYIANASTDIAMANSLLNQLNLLETSVIAKNEDFANNAETIGNYFAENENYRTELTNARDGFTTLSDRLNHYNYSFDSVTNMQACLFLGSGDSCTVLGPDAFSDNTQGIYKVVELADDSTISTKTHYTLQASPVTEGNVVYAYKVGTFASV